MSLTEKQGYVIIKHSYRGNEMGKKVIHETCEFVDAVKPRHIEEAIAIIDFTNMVILKSRDPDATVVDYVNHLRETQNDKFNEFLRVIGKTNLGI